LAKGGGGTLFPRPQPFKPARLNQAQPRVEEEHQLSHPHTIGVDRSQPSGDEKTLASRGTPIPTVAESLGANQGGHPSWMIVHAEGSFPFTSFILETPLPNRWKMQTFDKYDGTTNPDNHMRTFSNQMIFHVVSDPIWCRVFSFSLTGEALEWFSELPPNNIDCFAMLKGRFNTRFAPLRPATLMQATLVNIHQKEDESLGSYMD